jgi:hypothetical protein
MAEEAFLIGYLYTAEDQFATLYEAVYVKSVADSVHDC